MLSSSMRRKKISKVSEFPLIVIPVALERGNGRRVDGERVIVDYERGRINKDWLPRKLGGGKGDSRRDRDQERMIRDIKRAQEIEEADLKKAAI